MLLFLLIQNLQQQYEDEDPRNQNYVNQSLDFHFITSEI
jgi:hypothetical protein